MITTAQPILDETSLVLLKESTPDYSLARLTAFKTALNKFLTEYKWSWSRLYVDINLASPETTYDMSSLPAYNPSWGIDEVEMESKPLIPIDYNSRDQTYSSVRFYMSRDDSTINFTGTPTSTVRVWYYSVQPTVPASETDTLAMKISENAVHAIALLTQHFVHLGKRQRLDARNALLDYQQEINNLRPQAAANKARQGPRIIPPVMAFSGFRRRYTSG